MVARPLVIVVNVNGEPVRALVDSGSLGDLISTTAADQLKLRREQLDEPITLQLAVQGLRSKINHSATVNFSYQDIDCPRTFFIANISGYDMILGTAWLYQHKVSIGLNPSRVCVGSGECLPLRGVATAQLHSSATELDGEILTAARQELMDYAREVCKTAAETGLPPLREINHTIPLIDEKLILPWRPSRCPEALRPQWDEKRSVYLRSGRWKVTNAGNTVPMLLIPKAKSNPPRLRVVVDLRARNKNTLKMSSPLPDMEGILRRVARAKFRSLIDGQDAYEQIRIVPEHVNRTTVTTPDGNMVSLVLQQGDCNAPATYQSLMNFLFSDYIGRFMDVYLDDIIIYSDSLEDHGRHVKLIIDVLKREKLYLGKKKLQFLKPELKVLGRVVNDGGIRMDPDKVDSVLNWKTPTNRDLLRGFLGSVGYLADDLDRVRVPMGVLHGLTGDTVPFRWGYTHQRAFEDIKRTVTSLRNHHRTPLSYKANAEPVFLVTDGCSSGIAGVVCQGKDWRTGQVAAFFSAKLNSAQQNYPVHEIEMLAGVEAMLRHRDILLNQRDLSGRQARWVEKISQFDFEVVYVPGSDNVLADAHDLSDNDALGTHSISMPLFAGAEATALSADRSMRSGYDEGPRAKPTRRRKEAEPTDGVLRSAGRPRGEHLEDRPAKPKAREQLPSRGEDKEGGSGQKQENHVMETEQETRPSPAKDRVTYTESELKSADPETPTPKSFQSWNRA